MGAQAEIPARLEHKCNLAVSSARDVQQFLASGLGPPGDALAYYNEPLTRSIPRQLLDFQSVDLGLLPGLFDLISFNRFQSVRCPFFQGNCLGCEEPCPLALRD
jgi:hypothetical protein